jgi:hypothetical protein
VHFRGVGKKKEMSSNKEGKLGGGGLPSTVVLFRSGAKGNAHISDSFGTNTGAASHELIQMDSHFLVVRELSIQPAIAVPISFALHTPLKQSPLEQERRK